ncbi:unnamed protein product [Symbiodinium necroappetens]|uniref:Zinc-ribbon domain-containing protein n=2 Tax=Symbiodinium TaxID=2949 RepID=A0A812ZHI0_9DINO|nr:unnamed protein product [Symbiodinium sp. KB8]CAE7826587.1 unnamed protein product [Symbiodinium necroappetens]
MPAMAGISPRRTDLPWERMDAQEQKALEAYCTDLDRILESSTDGHMFLERVAALDQRYQEVWFADEFGSALGDPMQAFRAAPTAGVISAARAPKTASGLGMQGSEILQRHTALFDVRSARPDAGPPGPGSAPAPPAPRLHEGAGSFARNPISAAGPSARFPAPRAPSPIERRPAPPPAAPAMPRCSYCGAAISPEASYCSRCGMQQMEASPVPPPAAEWPWRGASAWGRMPPRI